MKNEVISKDNAMYYQWGEQCDGWHLVDTYDLRGLCKTVLLSKFCIFMISKSSRIASYTLRF